MMHWDNYGWGMGFGWVFMIVFWALVVLGVFYVFQAVMRSTGKAGGKEPLDIVKKRYAKGEISREEFERMKDDLKKG